MKNRTDGPPCAPSQGSGLKCPFSMLHLPSAEGGSDNALPVTFLPVAEPLERGGASHGASRPARLHPSLSPFRLFWAHALILRHRAKSHMIFQGLPQ